MEQKNSAVSVIDCDNALGLETNSVTRKFFNFFFVPILNNLPKDFKHNIKKTNRAAAEVIDNVTNHNALEVLYSKGKKFSAKNFTKKLFQKVWFNLDNSKAVRNRLKFVKRELKNHLQTIAQYDREINIISIASGSSRAVVETVRDGHYLEGTKLSITFLDKNPKAIEYSKELSQMIDHKGIELEWINDTVGNYFRNSPQKKFDIVEIVGLLDYFNDEKVIETFKGIYSILQEGGIVITANISHNKEERFITNIIDWPMIYRTPDELGQLVHQAGFPLEKMKTFYEPLKVHGMVVAKNGISQNNLCFN